MAIALLVPPDVTETNSPLHYRLIVVYTVAPLRNMAQTESKDARTRYEKGYDKYVGLEPRLSVGD